MKYLLILVLALYSFAESQTAKKVEPRDLAPATKRLIGDSARSIVSDSIEYRIGARRDSVWFSDTDSLSFNGDTLKVWKDGLVVGRVLPSIPIAVSPKPIDLWTASDSNYVKIVACVVRQTTQGGGWEIITGNHVPIPGWLSISTETGHLKLDYTGMDSVVTFLAVPDEGYASEGIFMGSSVNSDRALIKFYKDVTLSGRIYRSAGHWTLSKDAGATDLKYTTLTLDTSSYLADGGFSLTFNEGTYNFDVDPHRNSVITTPRSAGKYFVTAGTQNEYTARFYPVKPNLSLVQSTTDSVDFNFTWDLGTVRIDADNLYGSASNIWIIGIFIKH